MQSNSFTEIISITEKELVLEIERLKRKNGPGMTKKGKTPSKLDAFIRSVEEERNYYRDQADALQKMLRGEIPTRSRSPVRSRPSSRSGSPVRDTSTTKSDKVKTYNFSHFHEKNMKILFNQGSLIKK